MASVVLFTSGRVGRIQKLDTIKCADFRMYVYSFNQKATMSGTIQNFNRHRLLPAISIISVFFLLTGEFFSCCLINETFAKDVRQAFAILGFTKPIKAAAITSENPEQHAENSEHHCHGHETVAATLLEEGTALTNHAIFTQDGSCLSELSIAKKTMVGSESFTLQIPSTTMAHFVEPSAIKSFSIDHPRPQNKSSPPIYLLTLRILV